MERVPVVYVWITKRITEKLTVPDTSIMGTVKYSPVVFRYYARSEKKKKKRRHVTDGKNAKTTNSNNKLFLFNKLFLTRHLKKKTSRKSAVAAGKAFGDPGTTL